jgi:uncharacterized repeat protein (TIGR01451 family)
MIDKQPITKAKGPWQRKLTTALLAGVLACAPIHAANAFITNTVVATGTMGTLTVQGSATANVDVVNAAPAVTLVKTGTLQDGGDGSADPGDTITYTFTIQNTGNVTLQNIFITDPNAVLTGAPIGLLAPGATNTTAYTAAHVLTAADVLSGTYVNNATVNAHALSGQDISTPAIATTSLNGVSSMAFTKSGALNMGLNGRADAGDTITYTFTVTNNGPTPLHNVTVSDPLVNFSSLPGRERVIALLDAAQTPSDPVITASIDKASEPVEPVFKVSAARLQPDADLPEIAADLNVVRQLVRMSGSTEPLAAGDKIGFVFGLYNTGNVPLTSIAVDQPGAVAFGDKLNILAPNAQDSASVIFTRNVTAEEIAAGEIIAPATITANARGHVFAQNLNASLPISGIKPYDSFATATITPAIFPTLLPGQPTNFTASYTLTQADVDAGVVNNTATATALNPLNQTLTRVANFSQPLVRVPSVALVKTGIVNLGVDNVASVGDVVTYNFAVTNTGNVTLTNVGVTDLPAFPVTGSAIASLAPGITNTTAFTATHLLTQTEVDAGSISNQATASGTSPTSVVVTDLSHPTSQTANAPTIVTLAPKPAIALLKTVTSVNDINNDGRTNVGDTITYGFVVKNVGNQTLTNVFVTDPKITIIGAPLPSMAPGAQDSGHFTGTYTITLADMDVGHIDNTARVDGTAPGNVNVFDYSDPGVFTEDEPTVTPLAQQPLISLIKTQSSVTDTNNNSVTDAGDVIHYAFTVTNAGNVTLNNVVVIENLAGALMQGAALTNFAPNATDSSTFTATYTITAADMLAGRVTNQATARGLPPIGAVVTDLSDNSDPGQNNPTITPIIVQPSIAVIKKITGITDLGVIGVTDVGDIIQYAFSVKNTGNVPLTNVFVTDTLATVVGTNIPTLNAGSVNTTNFTASHVLTLADIAAGTFSNQATARGTYGSQIYSDLSDNLSFIGNNPTVTTFNAGVALVKKQTSITDTNSNGINDAGDVINYQLIVTNTGTGTLTNVTITDLNAVVSGSTPFSLAAGATDATHFTATHVITNAEVAAGGVFNQAKVNATSSVTGGPVNDDSDSLSIFGNSPTFTPLLQAPGIALIKTVDNIIDNNGNSVTDVGDEIHYAFSVVNIGNVDLSNVTLTDATAVLSPSLAVLPLLPVGATDSTTFTATHIVTAADAIAGQVSNSASVDAVSPANAPVNDVSDNANIIGSNPTITSVVTTLPVLTKTAAKSEVKRGEAVLYTITASNLTGGPFQLTDIMPPGFGYVAGSATANNLPVTPVINVRNLDFTGLMPVSGKIILKLKLLASTTLGGGKFLNNAHLINQATGNVIATARATVTIIDEAVFDCSDIIGRVFDDKNANGYMDAGEPGLPGVRVVTLNGLLITTDSQGRFHVPCAAIPDASIGSNYLLKLDVRTLPTGYKLTTENPRDVRVTRGKVVKLNFGASILREVRVDVTGKAFDSGTTDLTQKWASGIDQLLDVLSKNRSTLKIVYRRGGESEELAHDRVKAIEETVKFAWKSGNGAYRLVTTTSVEDGK